MKMKLRKGGDYEIHLSGDEMQALYQSLFAGSVRVDEDAYDDNQRKAYKSFHLLYGQASRKPGQFVKHGDNLRTGRPFKLDDAKVKAMRKSGDSLGKIAETFGVTRGAIQAALKR